MQISYLPLLETNFIAEDSQNQSLSSVNDILKRFKFTKNTEIDLKMDTKLEFNIKESHMIKDHVQFKR